MCIQYSIQRPVLQINGPTITIIIHSFYTIEYCAINSLSCIYYLCCDFIKIDRSVVIIRGNIIVNFTLFFRMNLFLCWLDSDVQTCPFPLHMFCIVCLVDEVISQLFQHIGTGPKDCHYNRVTIEDYVRT